MILVLVLNKATLFTYKNGPSPAFFVYFRLSKQTKQFLQQINVKNIHPVNVAGIRTHYGELHRN